MPNLGAGDRIALDPEPQTVRMTMTANIIRAALLISALGLAGCDESSTYQDFSPKADKPLPPKILAQFKAKGMDRNAPVLARIFKEERLNHFVLFILYRLEVPRLGRGLAEGSRDL